VPAIWVDSAVFDPKNILRYDLNEALGTFLASVFAPAAWFFAQKMSGVQDLLHRTPATLMPAEHGGRRRCVVAAMAGIFDTVVPPYETDLLVASLKSSHERFVVQDDYRDAAVCGSSTHAVMAVWRPDAYRAKLCHFWSGAFRRQFSHCDIFHLPHFGMDVDATPGWQDRTEDLRFS